MVGLPDIVCLLLEEGAAKINAVRCDGCSALYLAAEAGHVDCVRLLVSNGADYTLREASRGLDPLDIAIKNGHMLAALMILGKMPMPTDKKRLEGLVCLALQKGGHFLIPQLLKKGLDINMIFTFIPPDELPRSSTLLILANFNAKMSKLVCNMTLLCYAVREHNGRWCEALLSDGATADLLAGGCRTALLTACEKGYADIAMILLDKGGASVNLCTDSSHSPLHEACQRGHRDVAHLLLSRGAKIDAVDKEGQTPLYLAASKGHLPIVSLLREKGAGMQATAAGLTPLVAASKAGHAEIAALLGDTLPDAKMASSSGK